MGTFARSAINAKAQAATSVSDITKAGTEAIATPLIARADAMMRSVIEEANSQRLGQDLHICLRSRFV